MTTVTDSRSRFAVIDGPDLFVRGYREPRYSTARFDLALADGTDLGTNLDWPSAWAVVAPIVRHVPDTEALLRSALPS